MSIPADQISRTAVKATIRRGEAAARRNVRRTVGQQLGELERVYRRAASELEREIAAAAGSDGNLRIETLETLRGKIQARIRALGGERDELLESGMRQATRIGVSPFEEVPDMKADLVNVADDALKAVQGFVAEDGLQLSDRLWRLNRGAREAVTETLEQAVVQGHSASRAAQDFLSRGEEVPADVRNKIDAAQADRVARRSGRALLRTDDERSAYANALRVFRTEINRAHGEAFQAAAFEHPDVVGTRFLLSPAHPRPDICDMHASVNLYGLGPGVYPKGKSPWPAHPNTLSFEEVVFRDETTQADADGREDRISWLKKQPPGTQEAVLGSRKKRAALERGILKQGEIATPWRVLKERYRKRGIDTDNLTVPPAAPSRPARQSPSSGQGPETLEPGGGPQRTNEFLDRWRGAGTFNGELVLRVVQRFHAPEEIPRQRGKGAFHRMGQIHMGDETPSSGRGRAVMRHETGHYVDFRVGAWKRRQGRGGEVGRGVSDGPAGNEAMAADRKRLLDQQREYYRNARERYPEILAGRRYSKSAVTRARIEDQLRFRREFDSMDEARAAARRELAQGDDIFAQAAPFIPDHDVLFAAAARRNGDTTALADIVMIDHASGINMTDLIGSLTKNRIGQGHSNAYYNQRRGYGQQTEAFANAFDLLDYAQGTLPREFLRQLAPGWEDFVQSVLEEVSNA